MQDDSGGEAVMEAAVSLGNLIREEALTGCLLDKEL